MFTRIRAQIGRPWIKRPRGIALLLAGFVILTNSSAFAQRGGAGCAGMSGSSAGSTGTSGFGAGGGFGVAGGFNGLGTQNGLANPAHMMIADQQMQTMQNAYGFPSLFDGESYNVDPRTKRALRAEKAALNKKRQSARAEKQTRTVASRTKQESDS